MENIALISEWSPNNEKAHTEYKDMSGKKVLWVCPKDHEYLAQIAKRSLGQGCPICANRKILIGYNDLNTTHPNDAREWSSQNDLTPEQVTRGSSKKVWWICPLGHPDYLSKISHKTDGHGCPYCSGQKVLPGVNDLQSLNTDVAGMWSNQNTLPPSSVTSVSGKKAWWTCTSGHGDWYTYVYSLADGHGCPKCPSAGKISKGEKELLDDIRTYYFGPVQENTRSVLPSKELDIYIPSLNLAIEFNGLRWHSSDFQKDSNYHFNKWKECNELGIQLITVWEDDWRYKTEIVKSMLRHKIGQSNAQKVPARKTTVSDITYQEATKILEENHIQGKASGTYYLGLKTKDTSELVAVMVLKRSKDTLTLERYATSVSVVGGQSKLLSYVDKNIPYKDLITFADLSVSDGNLYERTGWVRDKVLAPDYRYVVKGRRVHKFNYRLKKFREDPNLQYVDGLSESQLAELNNLPRIYDCGKIRYIRSNPNP